MNNQTLRLLRALVEPAKATELGLMGFDGVFYKLKHLTEDGLITGAPGYGRGYVYSLTPAGRRLIEQSGTITPPMTYVPQGPYVREVMQVYRPGAWDAMSVKSAGWPT